MIWLKFLYYLRIFEATSSLIRMIMQVIYDIRHFLFVLLLTIVAFGDSFKTISNGNPDTADGGRFVEQGFFGSFFYVYNMCLGAYDNNYGNVQQSLAWFIFFLCTMFNMIIMLNLLISIISESYEKISANLQAAAYQERAGMISENSFLIPQKRKDDFCEPNKYLVVSKDVSGEVSKDENEFDEALEGLRKQVNHKIDHTTKILKREIEQTEGKMIKKLDLLVNDDDVAFEKDGSPTKKNTRHGSMIQSMIEGGDDEIEITGDIDSQVKQLGSMFRQVIKAHVQLKASLAAERKNKSM